MAGKVKLSVIEGSMQGKDFMFEEHDTFLFGRMEDCHVCLPEDTFVSRHHFIMEANPPDARIRDLGSLNGTYINGVKYGSRENGETPEQGAMRDYPEIGLKNGDKVKVGDTIFVVRLECPAICCQCSVAIAEKDRTKCAWIGGTYICVACKKKRVSDGKKAKAPEPLRCQKCGKDVSAELGGSRRGDYICESCRKKLEADPAQVLGEHLYKRGKMFGAQAKTGIAGYEIIQRLGVGGFGAVYLAKRKKDKEEVAIKVMLSRVAVDEHSRKMFLREIEVTKKLHHTNIVSLLNHGSAGGAFYFIMDYCEGGSVDSLMEQRGGKLSLSEAGPLMLSALEGLAFLHKKDFVHRDLKPANILLIPLGNQWTAKISDLGLAKNFEKAGLSGMTLTGSYAGTLEYTPREQVTNFKYVKPVTDVWSMAATFYHMITGNFPRDHRRGEDPVEVVLGGKIVPIRARDSSIPQKVADVIDQALDNDVKNRYQTGEVMLKALKNVL